MSQMKRLRIDHLLTYDPITANQRTAYEAWNEQDHLVLCGSAGTGKTFIGMYLALQDVLDKSYSQDKLVIVRSVVPTREMGYLPGSIEEKVDAYTAPYRAVCTELFNESGAYENLEKQGVINFMSTSFIRGVTLDDTIIIVDEMQNCTYHELDSIITRVGRNSRIIFSGDYYQSDLSKETDKSGILNFMNIMEVMNNFTTVEFGWPDIVRSDFVRDYIMTKEMVERGKIK
jgi:phosphate starvation-inducible PhoH-like protein